MLTIFVCSNPVCRASFADDPRGPCSVCVDRQTGAGWSTIRTEVPRRIRLDLATPAETAITAAMAAVEASGGSPKLTEAIRHLSAARDAVSDHVDRPRSA